VFAAGGLPYSAFEKVPTGDCKANVPRKLGAKEGTHVVFYATRPLATTLGNTAICAAVPRIESQAVYPTYTSFVRWGRPEAGAVLCTHIAEMKRLNTFGRGRRKPTPEGEASVPMPLPPS
jgi:hypothetical protein